MMNNAMQRSYSRGFSVILALFSLVYTLGTAYMLFAWSGLQSFDPLNWPANSLPFFALVFLLGSLGALGIWKRKKWGVYALVGTWILSGVLRLVFTPSLPVPYKNSFLALLLIIAFFLLLLPEWKRLE
jgi:hypothetical protein